MKTSRGFASLALILVIIIVLGGAGWYATGPVSNPQPPSTAISTAALVTAVSTAPTPTPTPTHAAFTSPPEPVTIQGYDGLTEDPYITSDGKYLLFDSAGSSNVPISLFYAKRIDYKTFSYVGKIQGAESGDSSKGQAAPAIDTAGNLYFLTGRSYAKDFASIWHGTFTDGVVTNLAPVVGISKKQYDWINMGATPSRDGKYLVFSDNGPRTATSTALPAGISTVVIAAKNADGTFTRVANSADLMKNVNTVRGISDFTYVAALSSDDLEIFFSAPGGADSNADPNKSIYVAGRASITEPFGVAAPLNTGLGGGPAGLAEGSSISLDGKHFYYHKTFMDRPIATRTFLYVLSRK